MGNKPEEWQGNPEFFGTLNEAERDRMFEDNGVLTGALLERFWRMSDMQGPPPPAITIMVRKRDVDRLIREINRKKTMERRAKRPRRGIGSSPEEEAT